MKDEKEEIMNFQFARSIGNAQLYKHKLRIDKSSGSFGLKKSYARISCDVIIYIEISYPGIILLTVWYCMNPGIDNFTVLS